MKFGFALELQRQSLYAFFVVYFKPYSRERAIEFREIVDNYVALNGRSSIVRINTQISMNVDGSTRTPCLQGANLDRAATVEIFRVQLSAQGCLPCWST